MLFKLYFLYLFLRKIHPFWFCAVNEEELIPKSQECLLNYNPKYVLMTSMDKDYFWVNRDRIQLIYYLFKLVQEWEIKEHNPL